MMQNVDILSTTATARSAGAARLRLRAGGYDVRTGRRRTAGVVPRRQAETPPAYLAARRGRTETKSAPTRREARFFRSTSASAGADQVKDRGAIGTSGEVARRDGTWNNREKR